MNRSIFLLLFSIYCTTLGAQQPGAVSLTRQFNKYHQQAFTEKLYVHTDKQFYLAGETIWFKIYYLDGQLNKPASLSRIAYVDVLNGDQKAAVQTMVTLQDGAGQGWMQLPFSITSGVFRFRAYTSWMKNFDADYYFEKPVTIVNTLKPLDDVAAASPPYDAQLFPEGGHLVRNVESKVAFRISRAGKGISCKGVIVRNNQDTIRSFETLKFGMGHFTLVPEAAHSYKAVFLMHDTMIVRPLSNILASGYVMQLNSTNDDQLSVRVTTNNTEAGNVTLFVHTRHAVKYTGVKDLQNGTATFYLDKNIPGEGISHFTVFDGTGRPVSERLHFVRPQNQLLINAATGKDTYGTREKVTISVDASDSHGSADQPDISLSVIPADALHDIGGADLLTYTWLQSDLRGNIESPQFYFTDTSSIAAEAMDLLMLTQGWRKFKWQDVLGSKKPELRFLPELRDHIIHAKATSAQTGFPAAGVATFLSVPGNHVQLFAGKADDEGITRFHVRDLFGKNELIIQPAVDTNSRFSFITESPYATEVSQTPLPAFSLPTGAESGLVDYSIHVQVQHVFADRSLPLVYPPVSDTTAFYGRPDATYLLDNYVRFSAMEDVLREYVPGVLVRRQREDFHLIMSDPITRRFLDDPLTLLNGVPVSTNKIMQYSPLKARKLEVVKTKYLYGPLEFNGIINFTTYHPDPEILSGLNATILDYEGVQYERTFYAPIYETAAQVADRRPDFRNTLYWSPDVMKKGGNKAEVVFYTADRKGDYVVIIEGMNKRGSIGTTFRRFTVK